MAPDVDSGAVSSFTLMSRIGGLRRQVDNHIGLMSLLVQSRLDHEEDSLTNVSDMDEERMLEDAVLETDPKQLRAALDYLLESPLRYHLSRKVCRQRESLVAVCFVAVRVGAI